MSVVRLFNDGWEFKEYACGAVTAEDISLSSELQPIDLPHDWLIYDSSALDREGEGWYRKRFRYDTYEGERVSLHFDGVYMDCAVWLNGSFLCEWKYGYTCFDADMTDLLRLDGEINEILVRTVIRCPNSRWYSGAGIYRNVWLISHAESHIVRDGIYISYTQLGKDFSLRIDAEVITQAHSEYALRHTITDTEGRSVAETEGTDSQNVLITSPMLWKPGAAYLYTVTSTLLINGQAVDTVSSRIGLRTLRFDPNDGFFINGEHIKLCGAALHHDLGCLGSAVNRTAIRRQLETMRAMGVNAIRTAHNPAAPELLELCDEMGIMVMSEIFDMWERPKNPYDYARFFTEWSERDVAAWVRSERLHPCIIMWSIGNEISDTHVGKKGLELTKQLAEQVRRLDPLGQAAITLASNYMPWENTQACADYLKFAGYNYSEGCYHKHHEAHPDWVIFGSETASLPLSRGVYHFPLSVSLLSDDDSQCSSLGNSRTSWGARSAERCIIDDRDAPFSLGQFVWSGFDYIGEPTPYFTKNSYLGLVDTAGFPKDAYYIFKAEWTDFHSAPMVHLFPYWDFSEGQLIDVRATTNAPRIELFFNGDSMGTFDIDHAYGQQLLGEWRIPYTEGTLEAVAYDHSGKIVARDRQTSFGDAARLVLNADRTRLAANGTDLAFIEISAVDKHGNPVHNANNRIELEVSGEGRLLGLDNGNSCDYDSYKSSSKRLFSGKLLAVIAAAGSCGAIKVKAYSLGLIGAELELTSCECGGISAGVSANQSHYPSSNAVAEIPVRKIELLADTTELSAECPSAVINCVLHPDNATYDEVEWRLSNAEGINIDYARIDADKHRAVVTALGDGEIMVRCAVRNGGACIERYSMLMLNTSGMGTLPSDPYGYIYGGLHSFTVGNIGNGNERGFATARDGMSCAGFERLDFGAYGSDQLTLDVFCLDSDPLEIELWEGNPVDGGELITTVVYCKPTIWNVYQPETFTLPRRLSGTTTLSFLLRRKAHFRGFSFARQERAYSLLNAAEADRIVGDSFRLDGNAVMDIGNNVSLEFGSLNFGETGATRVTVCGRTKIESNPIQLRFRRKNGSEDIAMVNFAHSEVFSEQVFELDRLTGLYDLSVILLPGSNIDLMSFLFE